MPRRIGVLGSLCNPPHLGHAALARAAAAQLHLERVLLVATGAPPHRPAPDVAASTRLELARAAAAADPVLEASVVEVDRPGPSYMADTLELLRAATPDASLVLLLGSDQHAALATWHDPERIRRLAAIAVAPRAAAVPVLAEGEVLIDMDVVDISSTLVRARAAAGQPLDGLVVPAVADLIAQHGLYRA